MARNRNTATIRATFGDMSANPGWLFQRNIQLFPELLSDWMAQTGCAESAERFIQRLGLADTIDPKEFEAIYFGQQVPGANLATILSLHLPGQLLSTEGQTASVNSMYAFRRSADRWRKQNSELPILELPTSKTEQFQLQGLQRIVASAGTETEEDNLTLAGSSPLYSAIQQIGEQTKKAPDELVEIMREHYRVAQLETLQTLTELFARYDITVTDEQIDAFLTQTTNTDVALSASSQALRFLRQSQHITIPQLRNHQAIANALEWEIERPVPPYVLGQLIQHLHLSEDIALRFATIVNPNLVNHIGETWLRDQIVHRQWQTISLPALDKDWLQAQESSKQSGLLFRDLRRLSSKTTGDIERQFGIDSEALSRWERSISPIDRTKIGPLIGYLEVPSDLAEQLIHLSLPDLTQHTGVQWLRDKIQQHQWAFISFPALDSEWLDAQPERDKARIFLRDAMGRASLNQYELAQSLGVNQPMISTWITGEVPISSWHLGNLIKALNLTTEEAKKFALWVNPSLTEQAGAEWLEYKIHHEQWEKISYPALDPQWLKSQPPSKQNGLLLLNYRQRAHKLAREIGNSFGYSDEAIYTWESGTRDIEPFKLGELIHSLSLAESEAIDFARRVNPALTQNISVEWLKECINNNDWKAISYPALDANWRNAQPLKEHGGLLLQAYRMRAGLSIYALGELVGVANQTISRWELRQSKIKPEYVDSLISALKLAPDEAKEFHETVKRSNSAYRASTEQLDTQWLDSQPERKKAGLLLRYFRNRVGMQVADVAKELEATGVASWECGHIPIPERMLPKLIGLYSLSEEEGTYLRKQVSLSNEEIKTHKKNVAMSKVDSIQVGASMSSKERPELLPKPSHKK